MPLVSLVVEQYVQWRFGLTAAFGLALLTVGLRSENSTCATIGGFLLVAPALTAGA
ncbi:hypothetical protein ACH46N_23545 [Streptomyces pristinaespiralis]|uniref:Membrane protein n=1 Tax=Streptomyces pristinaespiralis TaxID=38300 RepID=A0A0M3QIZ0_STRPR|nr:hypothetical protein [Streptomyces pristinaespiralis]ALC22339.1 membrane protein [Streptomyces pristinaespiralis]QMU15041.1 hypothetical protein H3L99_16730 [Streptomyces pristinaespiralis]